MIRKWILTLLILGTAGIVSADTRRRAVAFPPSFPPCSMITGTPAVTFTRDHGATLTPTAERLSGIGYTYGLAVLDTPSTLLAWHKSDLLISKDAGCTWRVTATFADFDFPPRIVAAKGGRAYAWSDNRMFLVRYANDTAVKVKQPVAFIGFGVDRNDADHVRGGGNDGSIWESRDGGEIWSSIGALRSDTIFYRFAFDPANLDHIIAGTANSGALFSIDGGRTWTRSSIDGDNIFEVIVSPADAAIVWAQGLDFADERRHIYRSTDGGATFAVAVDASDNVFMINGSLLAPHPTNPGVLYFVFGTYFQGYGTDVYRYDASRRALTMTHNDADDIDAIAFSPSSPTLMYLGLEVERGGQ
jgi:hypothetical protein